MAKQGIVRRGAFRDMVKTVPIEMIGGADPVEPVRIVLEWTDA